MKTFLIFNVLLGLCAAAMILTAMAGDDPRFQDWKSFGILLGTLLYTAFSTANLITTIKETK